MIQMRCREAQQKFIPFIDDELSVGDLDGFLEHLEYCEECMEEYDIYYTLLMGMRYLDEENGGSRFRIDSGQKLRSARDYLMKYRILHIEKLLLLLAICMGVILII